MGFCCFLMENELGLDADLSVGLVSGLDVLPWFRH